MPRDPTITELAIDDREADAPGRDGVTSAAGGGPSEAAPLKLDEIDPLPDPKPFEPMTGKVVKVRHFLESVPTNAVTRKVATLLLPWISRIPPFITGVALPIVNDLVLPTMQELEARLVSLSEHRDEVLTSTGGRAML